MSKIIDDIDGLFKLSITIAVFFITVIKTFFELHKPEAANTIWIALTVLVTTYIIGYACFLIQKRMGKKFGGTKNSFMFSFLVCNLLLMAIVIMTIGFINSYPTITNMFFVSLIGGLTSIPSFAIIINSLILFYILILHKSKFHRTNNN